MKIISRNMEGGGSIRKEIEAGNRVRPWIILEYLFNILTILPYNIYVGYCLYSNGKPIIGIIQLILSLSIELAAVVMLCIMICKYSIINKRYVPDLVNVILPTSIAMLTLIYTHLGLPFIYLIYGGNKAEMDFYMRSGIINWGVATFNCIFCIPIGYYYIGQINIIERSVV